MIKETAAGVLLKLKALPRSSRCEITGSHGDALKIKVTSPPVDGRANEEIVEYLSETLGIKKARITIVAGHASRQKIVAIAGCNRQDLERYVSTTTKNKRK